MQLSEVQRQVLNLMNTGWVLGKIRYNRKWQIQEGTWGYGSKFHTVNGNTANALIDKGLISTNDPIYNTVRIYLLTDQGRNVATNLTNNTY